MCASLHLDIEPELGALGPRGREVRAFLRRHALSDRVRYGVELAFEEMVSNVIRVFMFPTPRS